MNNNNITRRGFLSGKIQWDIVFMLAVVAAILLISLCYGLLKAAALIKYLFN